MVTAQHHGSTATTNPLTVPSSPAPAAPPSRMEIERKLSFKSAAPPSTTPSTSRPGDQTKRARKPSLGSLPPPPSSSYPMSGNESDSSSVTSSVPMPGTTLSTTTTNPTTSTQPHPGSPLISPATPSVGGLSSIAERSLLPQRGSSVGIGSGLGELLDEEVELEDVEEDDGEGAEGEGEVGSDEEFGEGVQGGGGGELERGMEGERVVKSGYLWKKQERRKAWKKRWFVLRTVKLAYYKDDKEYSLCRLLDLHTVHTVAPVTVKKNPFSFGIVTSKRTFFAKASSQDEMEEWVRAINGVRRRLGEREEEERGRREKGEAGQLFSSSGSNPRGVGVSPMAVPHRDLGQQQREQQYETHQGTYTSTFSSTTGTGTGTGSMISISPSVGGYFGSRTPSTPTTHPSTLMNTGGPISPILTGTNVGGGGGTIPPPSPMDTTNTLTSQLTRVSLLPSQPISLNLNMPMSSRRPSNPNPPQSSSPMLSSRRRDPSVSSISSDYFPKTPSLATSGPSGVAATAAAAVGSPATTSTAPAHPTTYGPSSDEDEAYFSDPNTAFPGPSDALGSSINAFHPPAPNVTGPGHEPLDPNKIILSAYLMKRSKGRGRKVWRKRWFYLTSQGLTYTKSHMDSRALRYIPLSSILDALDVSSSDEGSSSDTSEKQHAHYLRRGHSHHPSTHENHHHHHQLHQSSPSTVNPGSHSQMSALGGPGGLRKTNQNENTFRLITSKRTYVLCAPSEEDEIKWLAAFRALLNRERGNSISSSAGGAGGGGSGGGNTNTNHNSKAGPLSPVHGSAGQAQQQRIVSGVTSSMSSSPQNHGAGNGNMIPSITQQPPTPASIPTTPTPSSQSQPTRNVLKESVTTTTTTTTTTNPNLGGSATSSGPPILGPPAVMSVSVPSTEEGEQGSHSASPNKTQAGSDTWTATATKGGGRERSATQSAKSAVGGCRSTFPS